MIPIIFYKGDFKNEIHIHENRSRRGHGCCGSSAHAVLSSTSYLTIQNDAVTAYGVDPAGSPTASASWYVSSDGPLADSFFTMGGSKSKLLVDGQFAYLYNGSRLCP